MKYNLINENFETDYVKNLLTSRGILDVELYKNPTADFLQSPSNLKNIAIGAALFLRVVLNDKPPYSRVLVVVDSDNDGYTSAAIIY